MNLSQLKKTDFGKETLKMILKEVSDTGQPFDLIADKYRLPPMFIMKSKDPDELVEYEGEEMTLKQFHEKYPHRRCVVIRSK